MKRMRHAPPLALVNILQMLAPKLWQPRDMHISLPLGRLPLFTFPSFPREARRTVFKDAEKPWFSVKFSLRCLDANTFTILSLLRGSRVSRGEKQKSSESKHGPK